MPTIDEIQAANQQELIAAEKKMDYLRKEVLEVERALKAKTDRVELLEGVLRDILGDLKSVEGL
jgi:hypothetical protein